MPPITEIPASTKRFTHKRAPKNTAEHWSVNKNGHVSKEAKAMECLQADEIVYQSPAILPNPAQKIRVPYSNRKLIIKNMVSIRCKMIVRSELAKLGINDAEVRLGEVQIKEGLSAEQRDQLKIALLKYGFELMENKNARLIENIKNLVVEMVHYDEELPRVHLSDYLSSKLHHDYSYLSQLFTEVQGTTIEHFLIAHKIEKVKELLVYNDLTLTEIFYRLGYSSVAHLSNQFKKVTGLTPSHFKELKDKRRKALEQV